MIDAARFKPKTVHVTYIYIASTPAQVWQARRSAVGRPGWLAGDPVQPQEPS